MWDLFISHASDDKQSLVVPLVEQLDRFALSVWVDYRELVPGDSIRQRIDEGLANSRFGIVVLRSSFFSLGRKWTQRELDGLYALDRDVSGRLIPIWYGIDAECVRSRSPMLANVFGIRARAGVDRSKKRLAREIHDVIRRRSVQTEADAAMCKLVSAYDEIEDVDIAVRIPKKLRVMDAMLQVAPKVRDVDVYFGLPTEGGKLAFVALLKQSPRQITLFRLIEVLRQTGHRFVWFETCKALERHFMVCGVTHRQRERAHAELIALRQHWLYLKSTKSSEALERAIRVVEGG